MDNRAWKAFASNTPPPPEADPSSGYPTNGNPATGTPPTIPGAFWHHQIGEELRNVITLAGFDPTSASTTQVAEAIAHLIAESIPDAPPSASAATATANGASAGIVKLAASNNTTALNLAATPAGVAAQISNRMQVFTLGNVPATKTAGEVIYVVGYGYWEWVETAYFVGYRHPECGNRYDGDIHSATPNWLVDAV
ncbi:MAG: hypothetical protein LBE62_03200, partial [Azonexus sp.]|nr:hypothetical protein [Azonexus sp.]